MPASASLGGLSATSPPGSEQYNKLSRLPWQITASRLEQLPLELRQQIYTYVFSDNNASIDVTARLSNRKIGARLRSSAFPAFRNLLLTNRHILADVRSYFFASHCFRFVDRDEGSSGPILKFLLEIRWCNASLIRRISLPLYSIGLFGNVDCAMGRWRLMHASIMIDRFTRLAHMDLGISLVECLPSSHKLLSVEAAETGTADRNSELERWDWSTQEFKSPMRDCFEAVGRSVQDKKVEVNIYWSDLLTQELLPDHNRQLFATLEVTYKARLLIVIQQLLKAHSVRSKGPLVGFQRKYDEDLRGYVLLDDDDSA